MITEYAPAPVTPRTGSPMTDIPLIELVQPMPGFPDLRQFALVQLDDDGLLCAFRSVEEPDLRFLVVPPAAFFPEYTPEVDEDTVSDLGIESVDDVLVLVVVNAGASLSESTANLAAPLLINAATRRAQQVVLDDPELSLATPLVAA
jgi:flagellar assembly factor FliW